MASGPAMDLSSFTDLMTCILGVLVLIILLTGIDASQITVLVATPKEMSSDDKSPVFFECRKNQLFSISIEELKKACDEKTKELQEKVQGDETEFLKQASQTILEINGQKLDYTYALMENTSCCRFLTPRAMPSRARRKRPRTNGMDLGWRISIQAPSSFVSSFARTAIGSSSAPATWRGSRTSTLPASCRTNGIPS